MEENKLHVFEGKMIKLISEGYFKVSEKIGQLKMVAPDSKMRLTDYFNTETMFRIIQSIPSPRVDPLKHWLAKLDEPMTLCDDLVTRITNNMTTSRKLLEATLQEAVSGNNQAA